MRNLEHLVYFCMVTILDVAYILETSLLVMQSDGELLFIFYVYLILLGGICTVWFSLFTRNLFCKRQKFAKSYLQI